HVEPLGMVLGGERRNRALRQRQHLGPNLCRERREVPGVQVRDYHQVTGVVWVQVEQYVRALSAVQDQVLGVALLGRLHAEDAAGRLAVAHVAHAPGCPESIHEMVWLTT